MPAWSGLWRTIIRFERGKIQIGIALRNSLGVAVPLTIGVLFGAASSGLAATTGALNVSFTDGSDPYFPRAARMLAASFLCAAAVIAGALCGSSPVLAIALPVFWAAGAGMLVALDAAAADIGVITLVTLVVFAGQPMTPENAVVAGVLALSGGLLQTGLSIALWAVRRHEPERRVLGALFRELARAAGSPAASTSAPPASAAITEAQAVLSGLWRTRSTQGERYLSLLAQAERSRLQLLLLARLKARLQREGAAEAHLIDGCFAAAAEIFNAVADSLDRGAPVQAEPRSFPRVLDAAGQGPEIAALLHDAQHQMDALAGQLRSIVELSASSTTAGREAFELRESERPRRLQLVDALTILRANLTRRSAAFQHAVRLAVCIGVGQTVAGVWNVGRGYWIPMTIAIVLKPDFTSTFSRGALRVAGTFLGLTAATLLFLWTPPPRWLEIALIVALVFLMRSLGPANYGIFAFAVSGMVVLLFAVLGVAPHEVIAERALNTVAGGALALIAYAVWPTWERSHVPERLAQLLDAYRAYFRMVRVSYEHPERSRERELDRARLEARLARSNLEASVERYTLEPGVKEEALQKLNGMLAISHRLAHAVMALEAGLSRSRPVPARPAFLVFANHVELTLHSIAEALRGSALRAEDLPDLRADHRALTHSGDPLMERYALVNVETDRVTNSLNTLREQVLEWSGLGGRSRYS